MPPIAPYNSRSRMGRVHSSFVIDAYERHGRVDVSADSKRLMNK